MPINTRCPFINELFKYCNNQIDGRELSKDMFFSRLAEQTRGIKSAHWELQS